MSEQRENRSKRGSVIILVVIALLGLVGIAAWSTETGRMWQVKNQLQAIADSAALAGVGNLLTNNFQIVDEPAARTAAQTYAAQHEVLGDPVLVDGNDVEVGSWDLQSRNFTPHPGSSDPNEVRAVRVVTRRDDKTNGPVPTILGRAIGVDSVTVNTESIAYWGYAGTSDGSGRGDPELPITFDCCAISGSTPGDECNLDYCNTISQNPPNPCPLSNGGTATCLEFHSTPDQNACWTQFDGDSPSINTADMMDIVENGAGSVGGAVYLDNGTKTPVIKEIRDRFEGTGNYGQPAGTDTDGDGTVDSWVVKLPVVECQNPGDQCASGNAQTIVGFVCFDIQEVVVTPDKIIKGSFLCSSDPRCDNDGLGPGGTGPPGALSADYPVIVE